MLSITPTWPRFRTLSIDMKRSFSLFIQENEIKVSELNFTNMIAWHFLRKYRISNLYGNLIIETNEGGKTEFLAPVGTHKLKETLTKMLEHLKSHGHEPVVRRLSQEEKNMLPEDAFKYDSDERNSDYVYRISDIADMPGATYSVRRNDINHVRKRHRAAYKPLSMGLIRHCKKFERSWYRRRRRESPGLEGLESEHKACLHVLDSCHKLDLVGGVLFLDGMVRGFIIADRMSRNMMTGHFIKGSRRIRGAYAYLLWCLALQIRKDYPDIEFLNAEQDLGLEGLKQAKKHMGHHFKVHKYSVRPAH